MNWTFEDFEKGKVGVFFPFNSFPEQIQFLEKCKARNVFWSDIVDLSEDGLFPSKEFNLDSWILVVYGCKKCLALAVPGDAGRLLHCGYSIVRFEQLKEN